VLQNGVATARHDAAGAFPLGRIERSRQLVSERGIDGVVGIRTIQDDMDDGDDLPATNHSRHTIENLAIRLRSTGGVRISRR
jgi:hypothetical protein